MRQNEFDQQLAQRKIVPVVKIDREDDALPLADALMQGGLPVAEVTLRTGCALRAIEKLAGLDGFDLGAGTVLNVEQAKAAVDAGARFLVSPGFDEETVNFCLQNLIPVYPGVSTASEVQRAVNFGLRTVKFFPAEACGGVTMLKALAGPFHGVRFMPTGGINSKNLIDYLALESVLAVGGSWMVKPELYADGNFEQVIKQTRMAVESFCPDQTGLG